MLRWPSRSVGRRLARPSVDRRCPRATSAPHDHDRADDHGGHEQEETGNDQRRENAIHHVALLFHTPEACYLQDPQRISTNGHAANGRTLGLSVNITRGQAVKPDRTLIEIPSVELGPYIVISDKRCANLVDAGYVRSWFRSRMQSRQSLLAEHLAEHLGDDRRAETSAAERAGEPPIADRIGQPGDRSRAGGAPAPAPPSARRRSPPRPGRRRSGRGRPPWPGARAAAPAARGDGAADGTPPRPRRRPRR